MKHAGERPQERGLTQTGYAFEQDMSSGNHADQNPVDDFGLADDDFADLFTDLVQMLHGLAERGVCEHLIILWQPGRGM